MWRSDRESLDLSNWEAAVRLVREWEISKQSGTVTIGEVCARFLSDAEARQRREGLLLKYRQAASPKVSPPRCRLQISNLGCLRKLETKYLAANAMSNESTKKRVYSFILVELHGGIS